MLRSEFQFNLPEELIAQFPTPTRSASRLLHLNAGTTKCADFLFSDLPQLLREGDLLVFNNTKVMPARFFARKPSGGKVEILIERLVDQQNAIAHVRASKTPRHGTVLIIEHSNVEVLVTGRKAEFFTLQLDLGENWQNVMQQYGHMPLPPYIRRQDDSADFSRYQTVYASQHGAVAAPTAGLHFDEAVLASASKLGVKFAHVTLHVGSGTFQPIRVDHIEQHTMHSEMMTLNESVCEAVVNTKARGGRVIAVGTTSVRCLETAASNGKIRPFQGDTNIFIYPGYRFNVIDAMITNFHLPESTLLMLVCAFAGKKTILDAYQYAIEQRYRFFSYGDAMFIGDVNK